MIIDSHVHISLYEDNTKSLEENRDFLLKEMAKNGVNYAIVIPDNIEHLIDIADLKKAIELTKGYKEFFLLGSPQIIQRGSSKVHKYRELMERGIIKGLKFFPGHDPYYPTDERCFPYYSICEKLNLPIVFHTGENSNDSKVSEYNDPKYIVKVAKKYPKLKVIITHYFWPKIEYCYEITKNTPNIYFELAGTADPEVLEKSGGIEKMKKVLEKTVKDRPNQVIFGTDWPMCSIDKQIALVRSLKISDGEKEKIFCKNAVEVYKLQI
ncbi:amidohydrolase family protein [Patescibacteria group bacterium]|nr:amidohydrolase family protein [Patescibacteria group bacterium]MBU2035921.1 amidohydrolase family protein [Patescibacteria group bacterium]